MLSGGRLAGLAVQRLRVEAAEAARVATNGRDQHSHVDVLAVDAGPRRVSHLRHVLQRVLAAPVVGERRRLHPAMMRLLVAHPVMLPRDPSRLDQRAVPSPLWKSGTVVSITSSSAAGRGEPLELCS